ncbi:lipocalin family protein [Flavobacterium sp.]|uniref:lipocalin family protein n=1 Tax=Flavobacterium sp. TaxID=239 RepID=UPI00286A54B0|nr:lipocalin family protein [Flavobacterium sp.]
MKKIILISALSLLILSCKSKSATDTKLDSKTQVAMKGNWTVTSVTYPNSNMMKVNSFELADSQCFVGSKWKFVSNNNKGNFSLNSPKCTSYSTPITWFVNKDGQFVLKILDESKARKVKDGYVLKVANLTDNSFQLIDQIDVLGKATDVVYQFSRN